MWDRSHLSVEERRQMNALKRLPAEPHGEKVRALKNGMNGDKNTAAEGRTYSCGRCCGVFGGHPAVHRHLDGCEGRRARETLEMVRGGRQWGSG